MTAQAGCEPRPTRTNWKPKVRETEKPMQPKVKSTPRGKGPTPEEVIAEQNRQVVKMTEAAKKTGTHLAVPDNRSVVEKYIDDVAPASVVGRLIKFSKEGKFVFADDKSEVDENVVWLALCDETLVGWIKFRAEDEAKTKAKKPPDRVQGLLFDGFVMPPRDTLDEVDPAKWPIGLSDDPEDPWKHQMCLVLQQAETREMATFATTTITGRRAVGELLRHYKRIRRTNPGEVPLVRLKPGGFNHRDDRIGWVPTPGFAIVGHAPRDFAARPDASIAADLNDSIPF